MANLVEVTDVDLLDQLDADSGPAPVPAKPRGTYKPVDDPDLLKMLEGGSGESAQVEQPKSWVDTTLQAANNAVRMNPLLGPLIAQGEWLYRTGTEVANTPEETTAAIAAAAQGPDQSSIVTDWQAGTNNLFAAKKGNELIAIDDELQRLQKFDAAYPNASTKATIAKLTAQQQRLFDEYVQMTGEQFAQNPAFAAVNDPRIPGTPAQKTVAALRADPWGVLRSLTLQSGPVSAPSLVGGLVGSAIARAPGAAVLAGKGSAWVETGLNIMEQIKARGADMNDVASMRKVYEANKADIIRDARNSGAIVGAGDAAGAGIGAKIAALGGTGVVQNAFKEFLGTVTDAITGAGGEAGKIVYNKGNLNDPEDQQSVIWEGLGELGPAAVQQGGQIAIEAIRGKKGDLPPSPGTPPAGRQRIEPSLFPNQTPPAAGPAAGPAAPPPGAPPPGFEVDPPEMQDLPDDAYLKGAGWTPEQIADMNPEERAAAAEEARQQGVEPIDPWASAPVPGTAPRAPRASAAAPEAIPMPDESGQAPVEDAPQEAPRYPAGPAIWANADSDMPVTILDEPPLMGDDGRWYQLVDFGDGQNYAPFDELQPAEGATDTATPDTPEPVTSVTPPRQRPPRSTPVPSTTQQYTIDNPLGFDSPVDVQLTIREDGNAFIKTPDGEILDVGAMVKAGFPPERIVAQAMGDHPDGTEPDVSKVRPTGGAAAEISAPPVTQESAEISAPEQPIAEISAPPSDDLDAAFDQVMQEEFGQQQPGPAPAKPVSPRLVTTKGYEGPNPDLIQNRIAHLDQIAADESKPAKTRREAKSRADDFRSYVEKREAAFEANNIPEDVRAMVRSALPDDVVTGQTRDGETVTGRIDGWGRDGLVAVRDDEGFVSDILPHTITEVSGPGLEPQAGPADTGTENQRGFSVNSVPDSVAADRALSDYIANTRKPLTAEAFAKHAGIDPVEAGRALQKAQGEGRIRVRPSGSGYMRERAFKTPPHLLDRLSVEGIQDPTGELAGMDLPRMGRYGPIVRKNGLPPDQWREILIEEGYLQDRGWGTDQPQETTVADVYDLIARHMGGNPVYSIHDQQEADAIATTRAAELQNPELEDYDPIVAQYGPEVRAEMIVFFAESGTTEESWSVQEVEDAARLIAGGMDADSAFERAAIMSVERDPDELIIDPAMEAAFRKNNPNVMVALDAPPFPDLETPTDAVQQQGPPEESESLRATGEDGNTSGNESPSGTEAETVRGAGQSGGQAGSREPGADGDVAEQGPFGPVFYGYEGRWQDAALRLEEVQSGEAPGALSHPDIGPIALVWGEEGSSRSDGYGLAKILAWHPEVLEDLQGVLDRMEVTSRSENRIQLASKEDKAAVRLDWDGQQNVWLISAFKKTAPRRTEKFTGSLSDLWAGLAQPDRRGEADIGQTGEADNTAPTTEQGADNKPQLVIPGAEQDVKGAMQNAANKPLKGRAGQKDMDIGLFGSERNQTDLFDAPKPKAETAPAPEAGDDLDAAFDQAMGEEFGEPADGAAIDGEAWWNSLTPNGRRLVMEAAGVKRPDRIQWERMDKSVQDRLLANRSAAEDAQQEAPAAKPRGLQGDWWEPLIGGESEGARPRRKPKTAKQAATSAVKNTAMGISDAVKGLEALFGDKNKLSSGFTFDEDTYQKALPFFRAAAAHIKEAGKDAVETFRAIIRALKEAGQSEQAIQNMRPFLKRFVQDIRDGKENLTNGPADTDAGDLGQDGVGQDSGGLAPGEPGGEGANPALAPGASANGRPSAGNRRPRGPRTRPQSQDDRSPAAEPGDGNAPDGRPRGGGEGLAPDGTGSGGRGNEPEPVATRPNYFINDPEQLIGGTPKVRFAKNRKAIEAYRSITEEGREPTAEDLDAMASYIGWGSFGQELFQGTWARPMPKEGWEKEDAWLRDHLGQDEWESAQRSIINAHYTDPPTVTAMWDMVRAMGFTGGRVLEPSMGIGNFFGLMPRDIMDKSDLTGIELDALTGGMAKLLYPRANVQIKGYQDSKTPDGFYDLVIGNWPFAADGPSDRRYDKLSPTLHDYFFIKALDQTRVGGLVVGITSSGSMDKIGRSARAAMEERADLVASFRLPSGAFDKYAGTSVVTDIIILKKRDPRAARASDAKWMDTVEINVPGGTIKTNEYWIERPANVLGRMGYGHGTTRGRPGMIVERQGDFADQLSRLSDRVPKNVYQPITRGKEPRFVTNNTQDRHGSIVEQDGQFFVVQGERMARLEDLVPALNVKDKTKVATRRDQVSRLVRLRKAYGALIDAERDSAPNVEDLRARLKKEYDAFRKAHGTIADSDGLSIFDRINDPFTSALAALETPDGKPSKILTETTTRQRRKLDKPSISEAFVLARNEAMNLNIERVAELSGKPVSEVESDLLSTKAIYRTAGGGYEVADIFLSGNVRRKLRELTEAKERGEDVDASIEAIKAVIPKDVPYFQIEAKLGATWVPNTYYARFVADLLGVGEKGAASIDMQFRAGSWTVRFRDNSFNGRPEATTTWGHEGYPFNKLVRSAMNNQTITIRVKDSDGNLVVDAGATQAVNNQAARIREEFSAWAWRDAERKVFLERQYNEIMNAIATPRYDGSFLDFSGMALRRGNDAFSLRSHQVNAIWRGIANKRGLYAHEVGTGKTYTMGGVAVESRRYGIARKPLLIAHNANSATVAKEIQEMYPGASVLYISTLNKEDVQTTMHRIANEDWDVIVIPHSLIDRMSLSEKTLMEIAAEDIRALEEEAIAAAKEDNVELDIKDMDDEEAMKKVRSTTAKQLVHARNKIIKTIKDMANRAAKEGAVFFEDLGIDQIIVDEVHEFKKPPLATKMKMKGLNTQSSNRSIALRFLTDYVKRLNGGNGVHIFTGTPITNTLTEIYNMMRYVMDRDMEQDGVKDWDSWFNTFADSSTDVELSATADYEPVTRLAAFVNVAELRRMAGSVMDIVFAKDMPEFKPRRTPDGKTMESKDLTPRDREILLNGRTEKPEGRPYKKVIMDTGPLGTEQKVILERLVELARQFKGATGKQRREWLMKGDERVPIRVETSAANAGLDPRLFDMRAKDEPTSKVNRAVKNIIGHYRENPASTQVIFMERGFSDSSTKTTTDREGNKTKEKIARFNLVADIIEKLEKAGIPRKEIAVVDGSTSKEKRKEIADKMNRSEIRVVIGNTKTLGVGVNMQVNLRAMHHLDAPWTPGELEQRNGRGWRQGNKWNTVLEYRYITEKLDGRRWQVLAVKDRFIKAFMQADENTRIIDGDAVQTEEGENADDLARTLSEAAGDPRILQLNKLQNDLNKLENRERLHAYGIADAKDKIRDLRRQIERNKERAAILAADAAFYQDRNKGEFEAEIDGKKYDKRSEANEALEALALTMPVGTDSQVIGKYRGFRIMATRRFEHMGTSIWVESKGPYTVKPSFASIDATLRGLQDAADKLNNSEDIEGSIARLEEQTKMPFNQQLVLEMKKAALADLRQDLELNPVPPPSWLRHGAPIDTLIYVDGKPRPVTGHKWNKDGFFVITDDGLVPYRDAKTESGDFVYDEHEFTVPVDKSAAYSKLSDAAVRQGWTVKKINDEWHVIAPGQYSAAKGPTEAQAIMAFNMDPNYSYLKNEGNNRHPPLSSKTGGQLDSAPKKPVASITGNEVMNFTGPKDMPALRIAAQEWYSTNLVKGKKTARMADGSVVRFNNIGMRESTYGKKGDNLLRAIPAIPAIIENGRVVLREAGDQPHILERIVIVAPIDFMGEVKSFAVSVHKMKDGTFQYSFNMDRDAGGPGVGVPGGLMSARGMEVGLEGAASGLNLWEVSGDIVAPVNLGKPTPGSNPLRFAMGQGQRRRKVAQIQEAAQRILGRHLSGLEIYDFMPDGKNQHFDSLTEIIRLAVRAAEDGLITIRHEGMHLLRQAGVFTAKEWAILAREADRRWIEQHDIRNRYWNTYKKRLAVTDSRLEELMQEEAIADAFSEHWLKEPSEDLIGRIFYRVKQFLEAVANLWRFGTFDTVDAILNRAESGKIAQRKRGSGQDRGFELFAKQQDQRQGLLESRGRQRPPRNPSPGSFDAPHDERIRRALLDSTDTILNRIRRAGAALGVDLRRKFQDREVDLLRTQGAIEDASGRISEASNAYLAASLYPGRVAQRDKDLVEDFIEPLVEDIARRGLTLEEVDDFLMAQHAFERNLEMGKIAKPGTQFHEAMTNPAIVGGSGLSDNEASDILNRFQQQGKLADLNDIGNKVLALNERTLTKLLREGLISQDQYDALTAKYQYYVPLRGWDDVTDDSHPDSPKTGRRYDIRGREYQQAFGRSSKADSPLAYSIMQARQAIIRVEKNRVGKRFLRLAQQNPNQAFWEINRVELRKVIDKNTGYVRNVFDRGAGEAENVFAVKVGGKRYNITLHHDGLLRAMKGLGGENMGDIAAFFHKINRYFAAVNTSLDPEFIFRNFLRDLQQAGIVLQEENVRGLTSKVIASIPKAAAGMNAMLQDDLSTPWARYAREFADAGGKIGFMDRNDIEAEKRALEKLMDEANAGVGGRLWLATKEWSFDRIARWNDTIENTLRLATYVQLRRAGATQDRAAFVARELTVNFNRKGELSPFINAGWLFFNASVQGAASLFMRITRSRKLQAIAGAIVIEAFIADMLNRMLAGDDDDDKNRYEKIPWEIRQKNHIIMLPKSLEDQYGVPYIKVPLPLGWNFFHNIGVQISSAASGEVSALEAFGNVAGAFVDAFNPLGSGNVVNNAAPTLLDPAVDIYANRDFFGEDIVPREFDETTPWAERYKPNVSSWAQWMTDNLSKLTGGSPERAGSIDVSPEWVEYLVDFAGGGVGRFFTRSYETMGNLLTAEEKDPTKIPFARVFAGRDSDFADKDEYYRIRDAVHVTEKEIKARIAEDNRPEADRIRQKYAREVQMIGLIDTAEKRLAKLRKQFKAVKNAQGMGEETRKARLEALSQQMDDIQRKVRTRWNNLENVGKTVTGVGAR